jgi:hypothetical protein
MRTKRKKRTRTTTGVSRRALLSVLAVIAFLLAPESAFPQRPKKEPPPQAVVAGTIFREPGFAVAGAEAVLTFQTTPAGAKKRPKPMKTRTSARGEFAFTVPAGEALYTVRASAPGLEPQEKEVRIYGEERTEVYFNLKPLAQ